MESDSENEHNSVTDGRSRTSSVSSTDEFRGPEREETQAAVEPLNTLPSDSPPQRRRVERKNSKRRTAQSSDQPGPVNYHGVTISMAAVKGNLPIVCLLWGVGNSRRINMMQPDAHGNNPYHYAAMADTAEILGFLTQQTRGYLSQDLRLVDCKNAAGETPLLRAMSVGKMSVVKALLDEGSDPFMEDFNGHNSFFILARNGHLWCLHFLYKTIGEGFGYRRANEMLFSIDRDGMSLLEFAAQAGSVNVLEYLIRRGLDPHRVNFRHQGPLFWAVQFGRVSAIRFLVSCGCDPSYKDISGVSPGMLALMSGDKDLVSAVQFIPAVGVPVINTPPVVSAYGGVGETGVGAGYGSLTSSSSSSSMAVITTTDTAQFPFGNRLMSRSTDADAGDVYGVVEPPSAAPGINERGKEFTRYNSSSTSTSSGADRGSVDSGHSTVAVSSRPSSPSLSPSPTPAPLSTVSTSPSPSQFPSLTTTTTASTNSHSSDFFTRDLHSSSPVTAPHMSSDLEAGGGVGIQMTRGGTLAPSPAFGQSHDRRGPPPGYRLQGASVVSYEVMGKRRSRAIFRQNSTRFKFALLHGLIIITAWLLTMCIPFYAWAILVAIIALSMRHLEGIYSAVDKEALAQNRKPTNSLSKDFILAKEKYVGVYIGTLAACSFYWLYCFAALLRQSIGDSASYSSVNFDIGVTNGSSQDKALFFAILAVMLLGVMSWVWLVWLEADPGSVDTRYQDFEQLLEAAVYFGGTPPSNLYCRSLLVKKPLRSKYCVATGLVIARMDHYCIWLNTSIGYGNHRLFISFLVLHLTALILLIVFIIRGMMRETEVTQTCGVLDSLLGQRFFFVTSLCAFLLVISVGLLALLLEQFVNIATNMTTNERLNRNRYSWLQDDNGNPFNRFDRGYWANTMEFLGVPGYSIDYMTVFEPPAVLQSNPLITSSTPLANRADGSNVSNSATADRSVLSSSGSDDHPSLLKYHSETSAGSSKWSSDVESSGGGSGAALLRQVATDTQSL